MNTYQAVTDKILTALEKGVVPWAKPWATPKAKPQNAFSSHQYSGVNILMLGISTITEGFTDPRWVTFNQSKKALAKLPGDAFVPAVHTGAKSSEVVFYKTLVKETEDKKGNKRLARIPIMRMYRVFNVEQTPLVEKDLLAKWEDEELQDFVPDEAAQAIWDAWEDAPPVKHTHIDRAYYSPSHDEIHVPQAGYFRTQEGYWGTMFHEGVHATGHKSRLERKFGFMADKEYAYEELVAEIGSAMLCAEAGVDPNIDSSAAYVAGWKQRLEDDNRIVVKAAAAAQKAADYVLGVKREYKEENDG